MGTTDFKRMAMRIGYPSIFCTSPEDASKNLVRLITKKGCGYVEGAEHWRSVVSELLNGEYDLRQLNVPAETSRPNFSSDQWREVLQILESDLAEFIASDGES